MDRDRIVGLDALLEDGPPGRVLPVDDLSQLDDRAGSVHHLSPTHALRLLRSVYPELRQVPTTFLCITIRGSTIAHDLSPELAHRLDGLAEQVLDAIVSTGNAPACTAPPSARPGTRPAPRSSR